MQITTDALLAAPAAGLKPKQSASGARVFRLELEQNDRMAGSVPVWGAPSSAREQVAQTLTAAALGPDETDALPLSAQATPERAEDNSFGFFDLIDMINPLQHIPVVSTLYRAVTGDTIKPIAQIVGGAAFGGVLGAAGGIANAILEAETGKDIGETVVGFVTGSDSPAADAIHGSESDPSDTTIALASLSYQAPRYND